MLIPCPFRPQDVRQFFLNMVLNTLIGDMGGRQVDGLQQVGRFCG